MRRGRPLHSRDRRGSNAPTVRLDVRDDVSAQSFVNEVLAPRGRIDGLANVVMNQPRVERGRLGLERFAVRIVELVESDDRPIRNPVGASLARAFDGTDAALERHPFEFYGLEPFQLRIRRF